MGKVDKEETFWGLFCTLAHVIYEKSNLNIYTAVLHMLAFTLKC